MSMNRMSERLSELLIRINLLDSLNQVMFTHNRVRIRNDFSVDLHEITFNGKLLQRKVRLQASSAREKSRT